MYPIEGLPGHRHANLIDKLILFLSDQIAEVDMESWMLLKKCPSYTWSSKQYEHWKRSLQDVLDYYDYELRIWMSKNVVNRTNMKTISSSSF